jgi:hypothetical protein
MSHSHRYDNTVDIGGNESLLAADQRSKKRISRPADHGINAMAKHGTVPPGSEKAIARADSIINAAIRELGGRSKLTAKQRMILEAQRVAMRTIVLTSDLIATEGLLDRKHSKPHPLLAYVVSVLNAARLNAEALQLASADKRAPQSLDDILAE